MLKKILAIGLAAVMACGLFAGCGGTTNTLEKIKEKGEIVMYTDAAFPPFEYVEGNEVKGVDVQIGEAIAEELGVELKVENVKFDSIVESVKTGKADFGAAGMTVTDERKEQVDFTNTYITSVQYIIVPEDAQVETLEDLAGKQIGVQLGTTGDLIISDEINGYKDDDGNDVKGVLQDTGAEVNQYTNAIEAAQDMLAGRMDAVVIDKLPAESIVNNNTGLKCLELVYADGTKTDEEYAICIAKDNEDLLEVMNDVIQKLVDEGKIDEWVNEHSNA
jgi:ABC-type amino acid transport substrate-binding protein